MSTKQTEALRLALEALEKMGRVMKQSPDTEKAITAIREALAEQPKLSDYEPDGMHHNKPQKCKYPKCDYPCPDLPDCRDAEQTVEEYDPDNRTISVYPSEWKAQQEPVSVMTVLHLKDRTEIGYGPASAAYDLPTGEYKLYTSPPASKPWVGLTDEDKAEIETIVGITEDDDGWMVSQMFTLTEAKLRKNNA